MSAERTEQEALYDVLVCGQLFYDLAFTSMASPPVPGREIWTDRLVSGPGGIANFAVAAARLGLSTALSAAVGDDTFADLCERELTDVGIDTSLCRRVPGWSTPVTAALSYTTDRALVTAGTPAPLSTDQLLAGRVPPARIGVVHLELEPAVWIAEAALAGTRVFADVGWDDSGIWDVALLDQLSDCFGFFPNHVEAQAYTRTTTPQDAVRALADRVPVAVVTCGADGVVAIDSSTSEQVELPGLPVAAIDSTGAGDVFGAGLAYAYLQPDWTLEQRIRFATLCAALSVTRPGGAASAPTLADLTLWLATGAPTTSPYAFLAAHLDHLDVSPHITR